METEILKRDNKENTPAVVGKESISAHNYLSLHLSLLKTISISLLSLHLQITCLIKCFVCL